MSATGGVREASAARRSQARRRLARRSSCPRCPSSSSGASTCWRALAASCVSALMPATPRAASACSSALLPLVHPAAIGECLGISMSRLLYQAAIISNLRACSRRLLKRNKLAWPMPCYAIRAAWPKARRGGQRAAAAKLLARSWVSCAAVG